MDINFGEESNDMIMHHPDIEEIEKKLLTQKPKGLKIIVNKSTFNKEVTKISASEKQRLKEEKENKKIALEEEKKAKHEERERKKLHAEQEKQMLKELKLQERLIKEDEKRKEVEQKHILKEERIEEKRLANEQRKDEIRIAAENRKELAARERESKKRLEEEAALERKEKALKGMKYLLSVSEKYSDFYKEKISVGVKVTKAPLIERNKFLPTVADMKEAAKTEKIKPDVKMKFDITKELTYFENGKLHPYQVEGVTWLKVLYDNGINGILADEMGLGKTVQVIGLVCHLLEKEVRGPYLIIVPLSTLPNWKAEFERFAPKIPVVVFYGSDKERRALYTQITKKRKVGNISTMPVILTTYQVPLIENAFLNRLSFQYVIVDEGHRIKNHESKLSRVMRTLNASNRLLLTGTPLQNNIIELWALLNFLMPHLFTNMDTFASLLMLEDMQDENKLLVQEEKNNVISTIHRVLAPFMLRRLKKEVLTDLVPKKDVIVYCPMSKIQKSLYASVIDGNIKKLCMEENDNIEPVDVYSEQRPKRKCVRGADYKIYNTDSDADEKVESETEASASDEIIKKEFKPYVVSLTMTNIMMMFRKIVDHPYLIHFPLDPDAKEKCLLINEQLVTSSGKMMVLDILLEKLKTRGHKVLIFSTLVMTLDLIEELLILRDYKYCRIDGSKKITQRSHNIDDFNKNPDIFAFLLSTRAGGLGLNLTGADTCVFFDRDWNPQADIQAEARCHRIGQTKPVMVYTLVAKNTIDEQILTCGYQKRRLEKLVIKDGKFRHLNDGSNREKTASELKELQELLNNDDDKPFEEEFSNEVLDKLLDRSELYKAMKSRNK